MENPKGGNVRARGRARQAREQARRPGEEPQRGGPSAAPAAVHPGDNGGGGRRAHRGVPRVDPLPSEERPPPQIHMEGVTEAMAGASIGEPTGRGSGTAFPESTGRGRSSYAAGPGNDNTRPLHISDKKGTSGRPVTLLSNYFELTSKPSWKIFQYHCDFTPVVESSRMRCGFMREHKDKFGGCYLFDRMSDLKTIVKLDTLEFFSKRNTDGEKIRITLKMVNELAPTHPEVQRLYNTQMRRNLGHLGFQLIGRNYFDPKAVSDVQQYNLEVWQGVVTSIRQHEQNVLMCVDTVSKIVRKDTALQIIKGIGSRGGSFKEAVAKELVGCIVMTRYINKTYRIEDVDWTQNPNSEFPHRIDGSTKYTDYYKKAYDVIIKDLGQPLMLATSKEREIKGAASVQKKVYLIPELCVMTGLTESMRSNFTTMREIGNYTRVNPERRVQNLETFINRLNSNPKITEEMNLWGLSFSPKLVQIQARVIDCETFFMRNVKKEVPREKEFTPLIRSDPMHVAVELNSWIIMFARNDRDKCTEMITKLSQVANALGMRINRPTMCEMRDDRINTYVTAYKENVNPNNTQLVMFLLTNNKKERYDALKKLTCVDTAMPSQCVLTRTISKPKNLMTVCTKVAIQLNCKLGGVPWALSIPLQRTMICGYDTYHDSSRKGRSAGAFVASMNKECTRWYSKVSFHQAGGWQELSNHMKFNFTAALRKYHEINSVLPDMIIIYRDGVGDGQIRYVREWEIMQLKEVIKDNFQDRNVRFTFIVVNKRINTRFFRAQGNGISNPCHGTLVDKEVTRYDRYDFFLVSQLCTQGTVSPTMYNVIEDSSGLIPERIQRLTYKLTHLYFNCSATVSVPAPCQYAHKLAFLAGQSLHQSPREELCESLFYL